MKATHFSPFRLVAPPAGAKLFLRESFSSIFLLLIIVIIDARRESCFVFSAAVILPRREVSQSRLFWVFYQDSNFWNFRIDFAQLYLNLKFLSCFKSFVTKILNNRNTKLRDPDAPASSSCAASIPFSSPSRALGVSSPNSSSHSSKSTTSASSPCSSQ